MTKDDDLWGFDEAFLSELVGLDEGEIADRIEERSVKDMELIALAAAESYEGLSDLTKDQKRRVAGFAAEVTRHSERERARHLAALFVGRRPRLVPKPEDQS